MEDRKHSHILYPYLWPFVTFVAMIFWLKVLAKDSIVAVLMGKAAQMSLFYYVVWVYFEVLDGFSKHIGGGKRDRTITLFFVVLWFQTALFSTALFFTEWSRGMLFVSSIPFNLGIDVLVMALPFFVSALGLCIMFLWSWRVYRDGFTN